MLRSVIALIAGFALMTFSILIATIVAAAALGFTAGNPSTDYLAVNLAYSAAAAAFGGYATAALAPNRPAGHVGILAAMILLTGASSLFTPPPGFPTWHLAASAVGLPLMAIAGGQWRVRRRRTGNATPTS